MFVVNAHKFGTVMCTEGVVPVWLAAECGHFCYGIRAIGMCCECRSDKKPWCRVCAAPVAQRTEPRSPKALVAGSTPAGGTIRD